MNIIILGAGAFGTALGQVLTENGQTVKFYDPLKYDISLEEALDGANAMVLAVPSAFVFDLVAKLPTDLPLIVATKGLLSDKDFSRFNNYMVLSGPGFANDIMAHKKTKLTATDNFIIESFSTDYLSFDYTSDKLGVLMCGALKNVYALIAGMKNLTPSTEEYNNYLSLAEGEMKSILKSNGANPETVNLSCGKDDLKLTCNLSSRNFEFGLILHDNPTEKPEKTVESLSTIKEIKGGAIIIPDDAILLKSVLKEDFYGVE